MRNIVKMLIICFVFSLVAGCFKQSLTDKMMNYINNKYDDEFTYVGPYGGSIGSNQKKITVSSKKFPDKAVHVICNDIDGKQEMSDNYLGIKFEEQTYNEIYKQLQKAFDHIISFYYNANALAEPKNSSNDTTFEEYISDKYACIYFEAVILVDSEFNRKEIEMSLQEQFSKMHVVGNIFFVDDTFDLNNKDEYYEDKFIVDGKHLDEFYFRINNQSGYIKAIWEKNDE